MNKIVDISQLERHVGLSIISFCIELFVFGDEAEPIGVVMQLSNETNFLFCCSGEGKIRIRRISIFKIQDSCRLACLNEFAGELLNSVNAFENQLILQTINHEICIVNDDDDLVLYLDGNQVTYSTESDPRI
ncbi:unannotated protein [freshwater metagenome]|uniref:Unannotated protein n=1 Tax=freshwater metagenome TaxID=449393 RepID=A0A6J6YTX7_9ZZZZ|nr:hypothetical protein [Actinomycetota bacterium]